MTLEDDIRHWYGNSGDNINKDEIISVLLQLLYRIEVLEDKLKPLTDEMVVAAARMLNERQADACGVDRDDQWAIYCDDFKADARAMLAAAHGIKE